MSCTKDNLWQYLADFGGQNPIDAVVCPFAQGTGMGVPLFALVLFGSMGMGLSIRNQHPAPLLVAGILSAGVFASSMAGAGAQMFALVLFFGIASAAFILYRTVL